MVINSYKIHHVISPYILAFTLLHMHKRNLVVKTVVPHRFTVFTILVIMLFARSYIQGDLQQIENTFYSWKKNVKGKLFIHVQCTDESPNQALVAPVIRSRKRKTQFNGNALALNPIRYDPFSSHLVMCVHRYQNIVLSRWSAPTWDFFCSHIGSWNRRKGPWKISKQNTSRQTRTLGMMLQCKYATHQ